MSMTNETATEVVAPRRASPRTSRRRLAAAAGHSRDYCERQRAKGMPTGLQIDAMIGRVFVQNIVRSQGLNANAEQIPKLCELVAKRFSIGEDLRPELERRVAVRIERMRRAA